jgi:regulator of replication initiation timing
MAYQNEDMKSTDPKQTATQEPKQTPTQGTTQTPTPGTTETPTQDTTTTPTQGTTTTPTTDPDRGKCSCPDFPVDTLPDCDQPLRRLINALEEILNSYADTPSDATKKFADDLKDCDKEYQGLADVVKKYKETYDKLDCDLSEADKHEQEINAWWTGKVDDKVKKEIKKRWYKWYEYKEQDICCKWIKARQDFYLLDCRSQSDKKADDLKEDFDAIKGFEKTLKDRFAELKSLYDKAKSLRDAERFNSVWAVQIEYSKVRKNLGLLQTWEERSKDCEKKAKPQNDQNSNQTGPSITTQPDIQIVAVKETANFTVTAAGTMPLSYQWKKDGVDITGATNPSYTTPPTTAADNGSYFAVTVTNNAGSVTSNNAPLILENPDADVPALTIADVPALTIIELSNKLKKALCLLIKARYQRFRWYQDWFDKESDSKKSKEDCEKFRKTRRDEFIQEAEDVQETVTPPPQRTVTPPSQQRTPPTSNEPAQPAAGPTTTAK